MTPRRSIPLPDWPDDLPRRLIEPASPGGKGEVGAGSGPPSSADETVLLTGDRAAVRYHPAFGIEEIRIHPHAVARAFHLRHPADDRLDSGLRNGVEGDVPDDDADPAEIVSDAPRRVEVGPGIVRRRTGPGSPALVESVLVLQRLPGVVLQWKDAADSPSGIEVSWSLPARARPELPDGPSGLLRVAFPEAESHPGPGSQEPGSQGPGSQPRPGGESRRRQPGAGELRVEPLGGEASWTIGPEPPSPPSQPSGPRRSPEPSGAGRDADYAAGSAAGRRAESAEIADNADNADEAGPEYRVTLQWTPEVGRTFTLLFVPESGDRMQQAAVLRRVESLDAELAARARADARAAATELALRTGASPPDAPRADEAFAWKRRELHGAVGHDGDGNAVLLDPRGAATPLDGVRVATIGTDLLALGRHRDAGEFAHRAVELLAGDAPSPSALLLLVARYTLWTGDPRPLGRLESHLEDWLNHPRVSSSQELRRVVTECAEAVEAGGERERADRIRDSLDAVEGPEDEDPDPPAPRVSPNPLSPAHLLLDVLGGRADAFFGRLRLAPRIPDDRTRMTVDGIRMGDSRMRLSYHATDGRHTFRLEPREGRVPMNLVFEPLLFGSGPGRTWVDGEPADVDRYRRGDRVGVRLQLPLDAPREVVIEEEAKGTG